MKKFQFIKFHIKLNARGRGEHLRIIFNKVDGCLKKYDSTKYLALFHSDKNRREFLIELAIV